MVALTSLPRSTASYLQRVGRAGRLTGNALVVSLLPARPLELQRLTDPLTMIAGEVVPPACYLDATEILRRQYLASLVDRHARSAAPSPTRLAKDVFAGDLAPTSWLGRLLADARANAAGYVDAFLRGFGDAVSKDSAADLRRWAGDGIAADEVPGLERVVQTAVMAWNEEGTELAERIALIQSEVARMEEKPSLDEAGERDLKRLRGELGAARRTRSDRERAYWISALEAKGLLPNYALLDDTTRLDVGLWWTDEETGEHKATDEQYVRGSRTALAELAPGATFYVRGTSVEIDGVDLGTTRNPATVARRFCPACGWSERVGPDATATACPRCTPPPPRTPASCSPPCRSAGPRPTPPASSRCATMTPTSAAAPASPCSPRSRRSAPTSWAPPGSSTATRSAPRCCGRPTSGGSTSAPASGAAPPA